VIYFFIYCVFVYHILHFLSFPTRRSSDLTAYAIYLAVQDESRLEAVTKEIYMGTASHFNCNWTAVERNIRTAVARAWRINRPLRSEEHTSELQSRFDLVCRLLLEKKKIFR